MQIISKPVLFEGWACDVCKTRAVAPSVLITQRDGDITQMHRECLELILKMKSLEKGAGKNDS